MIRRPPRSTQSRSSAASDVYKRQAHEGWREQVKTLGALADVDTAEYDGFLSALRLRRATFVAAGGLATDHGHLNATTTPLTHQDASRIYTEAQQGNVDAAAAEAFAAHMLFTMA